MFDIFDSFSALKRLFNRWDVLIIGGILAVFFLGRLIRLDSLPIFSDEGIYIHWAKVAWHDAAWRFVSLTDGKQPLQTWGTIPFLKLFPNNALLAGRMFSVATGVAALAGFFSLSYYLFGKRTAFIASALYVTTPYFLFYDRMALVDSGVNAGFIWILFLSIVLAHQRRLDQAIVLGLVSGIALLAKSSVRLFVGLAALAPVLFFNRNYKKYLRETINYLSLFAVVIFLGLVIYNVQRLSPFFHFVAEKNKTFIMTFDEFIKTPFAVFPHNIQILPEYILNELGWVVGLIGIFGAGSIFKKDRLLFTYLLLWFTVPFLIIAFVSKVVFPRYLIFFGTLLVLFSAVFISQLKNKVLLAVIVVVVALSFGYYDYGMLFRPEIIPFPAIDKGQYVEGATVGLGAKEIIEYARQAAKIKPVIILAEGDFGMSGDVLDVFVRKDEKIFIKGYWPLGEKEIIENKKQLPDSRVFVVFAQRETAPAVSGLTLIKEYVKPGGKSRLLFLELHK